MAKSDAPLKSRPSTTMAKDKRDKGLNPSGAKKDYLKPLPTKDPKKKTPGVGKGSVGRM